MTEGHIGCCWCKRLVLFADSRHAEGLVGEFCSESCIVDCLRRHYWINPFPVSTKMQMGEGEQDPPQQGFEERCVAQADDPKAIRRYTGDWQ
ncbi:MAG: hypothetical protein Q8O53_01970 [Candidatus Moranbacteria bacterium]|nr:hypothetical protein [Candidatus Moranbacteria bacterium]